MHISSIRIISIHAPRVGCDLVQAAPPAHSIDISIHAPRVGCDDLHRLYNTVSKTISIHAPRVGCDQIRQSVFDYFGIFQSTHPVWGATAVSGPDQAVRRISIHAPRVGCDPGLSPPHWSHLDFNPRTPCGVRHRGRRDLCAGKHISIHAPRVGCDSIYPVSLCRKLYFNPRTPCGVRPRRRASLSAAVRLFQSTHPVWGATLSDTSLRSCRIFQSTHPVWGATSQWDVANGCLSVISIHAPRVGCDNTDGQHPVVIGGISIHAPRVGCDTRKWWTGLQTREFQSTHPVWGATPACSGG